MSFMNIDVPSDFFTPCEFPVEILEIAKSLDVIPCCLPPPAKQFFAFMLIKETYYKQDGISVFIQDRPVKSPDSQLAIFTNDSRSSENESLLKMFNSDKLPPECHLPLKTLSYIPTIVFNDNNNEKASEATSNITKSSSCVIQCSRKKFLDLTHSTSPEYNENLVKNLSLIIIDNVHDALKDAKILKELKEILYFIRLCNHKRQSQGNSKATKIRLVFLTVSLLHFYGNESTGFWKMQETFRKLEVLCGAKADTSSDIVALLRYATVPYERIVPFQIKAKEEEAVKLILEIQEILNVLKDFFRCHTFNPVECFGYDPTAIVKKPAAPEVKVMEGDGEDDEDNNSDADSIAEELAKIPDPTIDPLKVIDQFERTLENFGPWCADRALILLIQLLDRLKVRTPYERHYLFLGAVHTQLTLVQLAFKLAFKKFEPLEQLEKFSTPKLHAVLNILRRFDLTQPHEIVTRQRRITETENSNEAEHDGDGENERSQQQQQQQQQQQPLRSRRAKRRNYKQGNVKKEIEAQETLVEESLNAEGVVDEETPKQEENKSDRPEVVIQTNDTVENCVPDKIVENKENEDHESQKFKGKRRKPRFKTHTKPKEDTTDAQSVENITKSEDGTTNEDDQQQQLNSTDNIKRTRYQRGKGPRKVKFSTRPDENALCGLVLLENRFDARLLFHFLKEAYVDPLLMGLVPTIAVCSNPDFPKDSREAEMEHKKREEYLRKFRYREANLLIGTSILEDGIELPKGNLVIRFDTPKSFRSYLFSKGRANTIGSEYYVFTTDTSLSDCLTQLATYKTVEETLLAHSIIPRPISSSNFTPEKEQEWNMTFPRFKSANLSNAIAIVNRYCARLPSDTFTRLVPHWTIDISDAADDQDDEKADTESERRFSCTMRLPINSPVKWPITAVPMPSEILAKRAAALQTVVVLHANGELDDNLVPIGKEGVAQESDLWEEEEEFEEEYGEFRPGSTKRRQYYDKQLAPQLLYCLPTPTKLMYLYWLQMELTCPLPEEQNTRGRKLHPPEQAKQSFGIVVSKEISNTPAFPIYTRCGEVHVQLTQVCSLFFFFFFFFFFTVYRGIIETDNL